MKKKDEEKVSGLPENAYRELKEGEVYKPILSPDKQYREVTPWSVFWGLVMAVLFSAAAAFLGLKVGQVFEAAIPIAIIAVGLSSGFKRKNALGENVIIQSIGANSGVIVAGAIFTLPALYILQDKYPEITINFFEVFMSSLLGGILGILLLIPFRKYFVSTMHGKYPFPEATATTQVLVSGEKGGNQAKPLIYAGLVGGLYDFIIATFGWWSETVSTRIVGVGEMLADKAKVVFKVNTGAAVLGLGYIIGLKYSAIICAGSFLVWLVIIPLMSAIFGSEVLTFGNDAITQTVGSMSAEEIFTTYARHIGIGGIATAGVIGIINSWGIIKGAERKNGNRAYGRDPYTERPFDESDRYRHLRNVDRDVPVFSLRRAGQLVLRVDRAVDRRYNRFPFHNRCRQCDCHRRDQSRIRHDIDDLDLGIYYSGCRRAERDSRHGIGTDYRRCGMHGAFHGRRFYHRPEDRILDRQHTSQAGKLEIPRNPGIGSNCRRCNPDPESDIRFHKRATRRSASQCNGGGYRAIDEWLGCSLGTVCHRSRTGHHPKLL